MAIAGSFCLFCENGVVGLPAVTRLSPPVWAPVVPVNAVSASTDAAKRRGRTGESAEGHRDNRSFLAFPAPAPRRPSHLRPIIRLRRMETLQAICPSNGRRAAQGLVHAGS